MPIVWIASYPKSGNTWVRAFLANYASRRNEPVDVEALSAFGVSDGNIGPYERAAKRPFSTLTDVEIARLRPAAHALIAGLRPGIVPVKTHVAIGHVHGAPTINPAVTAGAIYIVRNPFDVVISYADHYGLTLDEAVDAITRKSTALARTPTYAPQPISDWATHVGSWTGSPSDRLVVVRYEDLLNQPAATFALLPPALGLPVDLKRTARAIRNSRFETLAAQEAARGFGERSKHQARFFREGRSGQWRDVLSEAQVRGMIDRLGPTMRRFGYLDAHGRPAD